VIAIKKPVSRRVVGDGDVILGGKPSHYITWELTYADGSTSLCGRITAPGRGGMDWCDNPSVPKVPWEQRRGGDLVETLLDAIYVNRPFEEIQRLAGVEAS
jgi:hypothetical protein